MGIPLLLYGAGHAYCGRTGSVAFDYPDSTHFIARTRDLLLLVRDQKSIVPESIVFTPKGTWYFVDRRTGSIKQTFNDTTIGHLSVIDEDEQSIFLAAHLRSMLLRNRNGKASSALFLSLFGSKGLRTAMQGVLVTINKSDFSIVKTTIGSNMNLSNSRIFPKENLIFIQGFNKVGAYRLPSNGLETAM